MKCAPAGCARDSAEAGAAQRRSRRGATVSGEEELRRIRHAKSLQAQVQVVALRKSDRLGQCSIQVEKVGPAKIVPPHIAEWNNLGNRILRRISEARGGEPGITEADAVKDLHRGNQIRRLRVVRCQKRGGTSSKVKGKARHDREKGGYAPATKDGSAHSRRNQALALSERQIVHNTLHKGVRAIEVVASVIAALRRRDVTCRQRDARKDRGDPGERQRIGRFTPNSSVAINRVAASEPARPGGPERRKLCPD